MNEEIPASPEMQKFFTRLLAVKENLKIIGQQMQELNERVYILNIELNEIIKEKE